MRQPIALLVNDIHISKDNISEFESNWNEMLSVCSRNNIYDIIVGGDMFTSRSSQTLAVLLAVKRALDRAVREGRYITIAEGNHDKVDCKSTDGYNHLWIGQKNIDIVDDFRLISWDGCNYAILVVSYFPESGEFARRFEDVCRGLDGFSKDNIILYIHEGVHGALGNFEIEGELPQEMFAGFKCVLCGHYHNRIKIKGTNIEYIGSSRQHNFGEDEEKGYTIVFDDGSYEFVKNQANIRYKVLEVDAGDMNSLTLEGADKRYRHKLKVRCSDKQSQLFDKQKMLEIGFDKVEIISDDLVSVESVKVDIQTKYDKQGIRKEYRTYCEEKSIDSELGIKYLGD